MSRASRKFVSYTWLVGSVLLVAIVALWLYYSEAKTRGHYFEQLRFRQLAEISRGFETNLNGLNTLAREHRQFIDNDLGEIRRLRREIARVKAELAPPDRGGRLLDDGGTSRWLLDGLLQAQARLMLFNEKRCEDGGDNWLYQQLKDRKGVTRDDTEALKKLGPILCDAGKLASVPIRWLYGSTSSYIQKTRDLLARIANVEELLDRKKPSRV